MSDDEGQMSDTIKVTAETLDEWERWLCDPLAPEDQRQLTVDGYRALIAAARRGIEVQWQPIETAKNEGQVLAFVPTYYQGKGAVIIATWCDWREPGCGWYDNKAWLVEPTHWLPIPAPPDAPQEADGSDSEEERNCECGAAGSGEQHEPWCPVQCVPDDNSMCLRHYSRMNGPLCMARRKARKSVADSVSRRAALKPAPL